jgi:hypothetical protein
MTAHKYQGKPCKRGHSGLRYAKGGGCVDCQRENDAKRRAAQAVPPVVPPKTP